MEFRWPKEYGSKGKRFHCSMYSRVNAILTRALRSMPRSITAYGSREQEAQRPRLVRSASRSDRSAPPIRRWAAPAPFETLSLDA